MKNTLMSIVGVALLLLAGCSTLNPSTLITEINDPERFEQVTGIDKHSSFPAVRRTNFERINLLELVDPEDHAKIFFKDNWGRTEDPNLTKEQRDNAIGAKYDLALAWFRQRKDITDEEKSRLRNSIQERMLSVSISRCNVFKTYLRRDQADKNFLLGSATTVAAILGTVLPGADAAQYLAGTAGIFSGIRSEYNQAYFASLAAHVIAKGIETRQDLTYRRIQLDGQRKSIDAYPLEAAIKDAIYFDGLCSVVEGLDQASASVAATTEPGIDAAMRTVLRTRLLKEAADMPRDMLLKPETLESIERAGSQLGLSLVGSVREPEAETDLFNEATKMVDRINIAADDAARQIEKALLEKLKAGKLKDEEPPAGETAKAIRRELTEKLLAPLKLDACYSKLAAGAIEQRVKAAQLLADAKTDEKRAAAQLGFNEATRAIATARDRLRTKEQLVLSAITSYRDATITAIQQAKTVAAVMTETQKKPSVPAFAKTPSCAE